MELDLELWDLLFQHFQAENRRWSLLCRKAGITMAQAQLLWLLKKRSQMKMNSLADALVCDASNITGLVDKLEARGLIRRQADPADRRVKMIALTPAGVKFTAKVIKMLAEPAPSVKALPRSDKATLYRIAQQLAERDKSDPYVETFKDLA